MSRSYKKVGGWTDHKSPRSKIAKRFANKKVRKTKEISSGRAYKKICNSWDICDYKFYIFQKDEVKKEDERLDHYKF